MSRIATLSPTPRNLIPSGEGIASDDNIPKEILEVFPAPSKVPDQPSNSRPVANSASGSTPHLTPDQYVVEAERPPSITPTHEVAIEDHSSDFAPLQRSIESTPQIPLTSISVSSNAATPVSLNSDTMDNDDLNTPLSGISLISSISSTIPNSSEVRESVPAHQELSWIAKAFEGLPFGPDRQAVSDTTEYML